MKRSRACTGFASNDSRATSYSDDFGHLPQIMLGVHIQPLGPGYVFGDTTRAVVIIKRGQHDNLVGSTIGANRVAIYVNTLALRTWTLFSLASSLSTGAFFRVACHYDINTTGNESNDVRTTRYGSNVRDGIKVIRDFPRHVYRVP